MGFHVDTRNVTPRYHGKKLNLRPSRTAADRDSPILLYSDVQSDEFYGATQLYWLHGVLIFAVYNEGITRPS
jgi:hypothetical protein